MRNGEWDCEEVRRRLETMAPEEWDEETARRLQQHWERCPSCAAEARWERLWHRALGEWPVPPPRPTLLASIRSRRRDAEAATLPPLVERWAWVAALLSGVGALLWSWPLLRAFPLPRVGDVATRAGNAFLHMLAGGRYALGEWLFSLERALLNLWGQWEQWASTFGSVWLWGLLILLIGQAVGFWWTRRRVALRCLVHR